MLLRRYFADLVITYMQDVLAATLLGVGHTSHAAGGHAAALPPPMFPGNSGLPNALCYRPGHDFKLLVTSHEASLQPAFQSSAHAECMAVVGYRC